MKWKAYKMIVRPAVIGEDATDKKAGGWAVGGRDEDAYYIFLLGGTMDRIRIEYIRGTV